MSKIKTDLERKDISKIRRAERLETQRASDQKIINNYRAGAQDYEEHFIRKQQLEAWLEENKSRP
jgi:hypothetical protein